MTITTNAVDGVVTITLGNSFDFDSVVEFREAYVSNPGAEYQVDFRNTEYMESSGLGMLLNMLRHTGDGSIIRLINCRPHILKILQISNFQQKFEIG
ncbi:STAS domain-containing protein [Halioxenophilus sp. WMMB6]|uniref:STAS domain-containing protein n=1 Tax=Halioxenophilus sp. WMMB6 TaxID=3073815 RepID=UPI00295E2352|nr:STAS domain-containing protein [Halioxenophilus sp. WMMB6]